MAGTGERGQGLDVVVAQFADGDEDPVGAVRLRFAQGLADDRHQTGAGLAGRLGDELLDPQPEAGDAGIEDERELVAPGAGAGGHHRGKAGRRRQIGEGRGPAVEQAVL
jgi:hypothetical protein